MTTEGQGRADDPVGFGIPVMIDGPWAEPRIYPDMQGILDNPDAAYAKLKEMGKGLFGANGAGLGGLSGLGGLTRRTRSRPGDSRRAGQRRQPGDPLGGQLGETIGNLLQQGLRRPGQGGSGQGGSPQGGASRCRARAATLPRCRPLKRPRRRPAAPATAPTPSDAAPQPDNQPMNEVLRQLFNR